MQKYKFSEVRLHIESRPGLYQIFTNEGISLKVGIAKELKKRLLVHGASRQNKLKLINQGLGWVPSNVKSSQSILAKHLYFDSSITQNYDLKTELGRTSWLENECYIVIQYTSTRDEARVLEKEIEAEGAFRYVGRVCNR